LNAQLGCFLFFWKCSGTLLKLNVTKYLLPAIVNKNTRTQMIENHTFDEIRIGDKANLVRTLAIEDVQLFAAVSGDISPAQVDREHAITKGAPIITAHAMWGGALIATVICTEYPGPGTIYLSQTLCFVQPIFVGDTLDIRVTVIAKDDSNHHITLDCHCTNQHGFDVITGSALVLATTERIALNPMPPMQVRLTDKTLRYRQLLALVDGLAPITVAVVHPCSEDALRGAVEAGEMGLIIPILIGPETKIRAVAGTAKIALKEFRIVDAPHSHAAAAIAVKMAREGEVEALMKGSLHTDELMAEVVKTVDGLRTDRRISQIFVMDVPSYPRPLMITDAAINVEPDLNTKRDIILNAIDLAHAMKIVMPKIAVLAAVETVNPKMQSTIDAAALCVMAKRGQITGAIVDGPLAFDDAISLKAANDKDIISTVAGQADILIAPNLEAANMIAKQLQYLADSRSAGIVMGAKVPLILTSRADDAIARVASCALALLVVKAKATAVQASGI
jgi:phosphotransacetylase/acyl dehydratase